LKPKINLFIFDFSNNGLKKLFWPEQLKNNLRAMMIADDANQFLINKKLPNAQIVKNLSSTSAYTVSMKHELIDCACTVQTFD